MGSTSACTAEKSFIAMYGLPCKLETNLFGEQKASILNEYGSLSGSSEGVRAELGLAIAGTTIMGANSFKIHSILSKASSVHAHSNSADSNALKKPDKALPCPRCNSLDTKFCYYNNYNVNQPRHFCKGCQRYWTAGGTLRNVAIGAGRRKRKLASLESDSQDSTVEECSSHDLPVKVFSSADSGSVKDEFAHGTSQLVNHRMLPFERIQCAAFSNPPSPSVKKTPFSESMHQKRTAMSHDKVEPLCNSHNFKDQASTFYEYLRPKHIEAQPDNVGAPNKLHECNAVYVEHMKRSTLNIHMDLQRNECSDMGCKLVPATSCEMQASNESGCASSLTTQAVSIDACVTEGKSDVMDSEVTKEGDEPDKSKILQTARLSSCKMHTDGGGSAMSSFVHRDSSTVATIAPTWKGPLENRAVKPAWPIPSPALTWGPTADKALLWGFPWGPAAHDVDTAKAALIPNAGSFQKQQTESNRPSEMRLWVPKTLRIKDADEAARSSIWSTLGFKDRQGSVLSEKVEAVFRCHAKDGSASATPSPHTSPAALTQSMAFQESS